MVHTCSKDLDQQRETKGLLADLLLPTVVVVVLAALSVQAHVRKVLVLSVLYCLPLTAEYSAVADSAAAAVLATKVLLERMAD